MRLEKILLIKIAENLLSILLENLTLNNIQISEYINVYFLECY